MFRILLLSAMLLIVSGCTALPKGIAPVRPFQIESYLGTWYEIARLDHSFERGLEQVTASYSMRDEGGIRVINRGYSSASGEWSQAEGKAYFVKSDNQGHLKVSFFGPFYGAYVVFELGSDYQYAFVSGPNRNYLWLLARQPEVSDDLKSKFIRQVQQLGFDGKKLIFPRQVSHE